MKILERTEGEPDNAVVPYALMVDDQGSRRIIRYLPQALERVTVQQLQIKRPDEPECRRSLGGVGSIMPD